MADVAPRVAPVFVVVKGAQAAQLDERDGARACARAPMTSEFFQLEQITYFETKNLWC